MSIRKNILLWILTPLILISVIAATFCYCYIRRTIERNISDQLVLAADEMYDHIHMFLKAKKDRIADFSTDGFITNCIEGIVHGVDADSYTSRLNSHLIRNKKPVDEENILEVFVSDLDGNVIGSTEASHVGGNISDEVIISRVREDGVYINDLHYSPAYGQNTFEVAGLLTVSDGIRPIGIIVNRYRGECLAVITRSGIADGFRKKTMLKGMGETGEVYIVNSKRLMITDSKFVEEPILKQVVDTEGVGAAFENQKGMVGTYHDYRGVRVLGVSRYIGDINWVVLAEKDILEAFVPLAHLRNIAIIYGVTCMVVIVTIVVFVSNEITGPIGKLIEGTVRIAAGDLEHPILIDKKNDEMKVLGESFNLMMYKLRESEEKNAGLLSEITRKGEDEWHRTFDVITDVITIHDKDYRIIRANKAFFEKFNVSKEDLSYSRCYEIFHGMDEPWPTCPLTKAAASLQSEHEEVEDSHMGGTFIVSTYPLLDEEGRFCGAVHQAKDITEMKRREDALIMMNNAIEQAGEAVVITDTEGTIEYVNPAFEKITGYSAAEAIGRNPRVLKSGKHPVEFYRDMWDTIIAGEIWHGDVINRKKDGSLYHEEMTISPVKKSSGTITHFIVIKRDVTLQKEAEKQLIAKSNIIERVNRELEEFVYIISHDLKEPLFVIEGYTSRIYRAYKDIYDDKSKQFTERIRKNVQVMSQKIQEIMEVLKVGRVAYDFRNHDSSAIINDVVNDLEERIREEKIQVIVERNLPAVFCDERRMKDVFSNLITNAIKFMGSDNDTSIKLTHHSLTGEKRNGAGPQRNLSSVKEGEWGLKRIRIGCRSNGSNYIFFVEDTGIGIREEYHEQIFKIFKRLMDIEAEGTGVGLAIVKKIVELHAGELWVESPLQEGKGSRFCFTIPKAGQISDS